MKDKWGTICCITLHKVQGRDYKNAQCCLQIMDVYIKRFRGQDSQKAREIIGGSSVQNKYIL